MSCQADCAQRLREAGLRVTPQRVMIAGALRHGGGHSTADQVHERVQAEYPQAISLATVYRTLTTLREHRLVGQIDAGHGSTLYEWLDPDRPHHHALCTVCGAEREIDVRLLDRFAHALRAEQGFEPFLDHLVLLGRCRECAGAAAR